MTDKLNIYQKLQLCRVELQKTKMKKSGQNKFANYDYFELGDFLPRVNELMSEHGLTAIFLFTKEEATLILIDTDKTDDNIKFSSPVAMAQLKGCHDVQNIGATQTYMRRYLYIMAFEIAEHDAIEILEKEEKDDSVEVGGKTIDANKVKALRDKLEATNTDERQFCDFYHVDSLEEMTVSEWMRGMNSLDKKAKVKGTTEIKENLLGGK
jgi:DNA-binding transcriptional regulator YiaG